MGEGKVSLFYAKGDKMSLDTFEEWLEKKHPEHSKLMDEFTQDMNAEQEEMDNLWALHILKYGREKTCRICDSPIFYLIPKHWDMTEEDSTLWVPCLNGCGLLEIKNTKGVIEERFTAYGEHYDSQEFRISAPSMNSLAIQGERVNNDE